MPDLDRFTREYSHRLGTLTGAQLQAALDRFDLGELEYAEPIRQGVSGQNVWLRTTRGEWVLRANPWHRAQLETERFFAGLIRERTRLDAPWPYRVATDEEALGFGYAIMPRLRGDDRSEGDHEERLARARALGTALAELHRIQWDHCGVYDPGADTIVSPGKPIREWKIENLRKIIALARGHSDATTLDDVRWIDAVVEQNLGSLDEPFTPTYVHHDFREPNTVAVRDGADFRVTGVFDLTEGYFGHPEEDLVRAAWEYAKDGNAACSRAYIDAYRAAAPLAPNARERHAIFMLHDCLTIWEYGQHSGTFPPQVRFRDFAEHFVTLGLI